MSHTDERLGATECVPLAVQGLTATCSLEDSVSAALVSVLLDLLRTLRVGD